MNKTLVDKLTDAFYRRLQAKTGWGRNEVFREFQAAVAEALAALLDDRAASL